MNFPVLAFVYIFIHQHLKKKFTSDRVKEVNLIIIESSCSFLSLM